MGHVKEMCQGSEEPAPSHQFSILLVKYQGTVITRERMIEFIEERTGNYIEDNTVSVHVKRLREKLRRYNNESRSRVD